MNNENIFQFEHPEKLHCHVSKYSSGFSLLKISILSKERKEAILDFPHVSYFSGPMQWWGADFRVVNQAESNKFAVKIMKLEDQIPQSKMREGRKIVEDILENNLKMRLYIVKAENLEDIEIKILSSLPFQLLPPNENYSTAIRPEV